MGGSCLSPRPRLPPLRPRVCFFNFYFITFPHSWKCLFGSEDAESSPSGWGRPGRVSVFNFNCLGKDKTAACVRVCACRGPLNRLHLLWGPAVFREVAFLHAPS